MRFFYYIFLIYLINEASALTFNNKPSFENLKKAFESNYIYFSEKFTEVDYLKIEENVILFLPSILSHSIELKRMTKEEISKYLELDFTD